MLKDLRIVEIGEGHAVQVAGLVLAGLGADVLKVERSGGDPARGMAPFANWNRGKRSLLLDLDTADGLDILRNRLADADAVIHQFTPKRAKALGLDDESLAALNPALIVCGITGSPHNHPDAERSDDELLVAARLGQLYENDGWRCGPIVYRLRSGYWSAAFLAAGGILARLVMRLDTGQGGPAHTSIMQGLLSQMPMVWARNSSGPMPNPPVKDYDTLRIRGLTQTFECGDGNWLQILDPTQQFDYAMMPTMWECLAEGADLSTEAGVRAAFKMRPLQNWLVDVRDADIPVEPILPLGQELFHEDALANGYLVDIDDPDLGKTTQPNIPYHTNLPLPKPVAAPSRGAGGDRDWAPRTALEPTRRARGEVLQGVKVLDLGMFLAGPMGPSMMGDLGAEVIKVEPLSGDRLRHMHHNFQAAARSKRSIAVDLTKPEGREILSRLLSWADVVHHNMRFKGVEKLGLSEEAIRSVNPRVAFGYVSAYGQRGSRGNWPGYDSIFSALAGTMLSNAGEGNQPVMPMTGPFDLITAQSCFVSMTAAYYAQRVHGEAWTTQSSLLGTSTLTQGEVLVKDGKLTETYHLDSHQTGYGPYHRIYECRGRKWVAVAAHRPHQREAMRNILGADEAGFVEAASQREAADLLAELDRAGVPCEPVAFENAMNRFFDNSLNRELNLVSVLGHEVFGTVEQPGQLWDFGSVPVVFKRACPAIGQHTDEIMRQMGYSEKDIASHREQGIVG